MSDIVVLSIAFFVSFVLSCVFTPGARALFRRLNIVDRPDGIRKTHAVAIPTAGGVPITVAAIAAAATATYAGIQPYMQSSWWLLAALAVILCTGLADDLRGLRPVQKLAGQGFAAVLACVGGVRLLSPGAVPDLFNVAVTCFWLMLCSNAFNLIDGVDGLAAGLGVVAASSVAIAGVLNGNMPLAVTAVILAGALLAFAVYNFSPASIFLGDSGSLMAGFVVGCLLTSWVNRAGTLWEGLTYMGAVAVPLADTGLAVVRRYIRNEPVFRADRSHIHHRLLQRGLSSARVVLTLCAVAVVGAGLAVIEEASHARYTVELALLWCLVAVACVRRLGYPELSAAYRVLSHGGLRQFLRVELALEETRRQLGHTAAKDDWLAAVCDAAKSAGFSVVDLCSVGHASSVSPEPDALWDIRIPVMDAGHLRLASSRPVDPVLVAGYVALVSRDLMPKQNGLNSNPADNETMWIRRVRTVAHSPREVFLVFTAAILLRAAKYSITRFPLFRVTRVFGGGATQTRSTRPRRVSTTVIAWAVERASKWMPTEGNCLLKALATQRLLTWHGYQPELHVGACKAVSNQYSAHAWVELDGNVVIGGTADELSAFPWHVVLP